MIKGTVESISKTSVVVSVGSTAKTLTGAAVEALAKSLNLGDAVEFDKEDNPKKFQKAKQVAAGKTERRASTSTTTEVKQHIYY